MEVALQEADDPCIDCGQILRKTDVNQKVRCALRTKFRTTTQELLSHLNLIVKPIETIEENKFLVFDYFLAMTTPLNCLCGLRPESRSLFAGIAQLCARAVTLQKRGT